MMLLDYDIIYTKFSVKLFIAAVFYSYICWHNLGQELAQNLLEQFF